VDIAVALTAGADVAVTVAPGEAVGVVGAPGSGKTLITQVAAGLAGRGTHPEWESTAALVVDDAIVHEALTVEATLRYWASVAEPSLFGTALTERVAEVIDATGLGRWRHTPVEHCHQVVRRAITVAVALFDRPAVLVLDEPLRKMAPRHRQTILLLLDALRAHGIGLLYATRCEDQASALCDRVITLPDPVDTAASRAS
jgi:ABC-type multidrug transport system ATPase subunit